MFDSATIVASILGGIGTGIVGIAAYHFQHRFTANTELISETISEIERMTEDCAAHAVLAWNIPGDPHSAETVAIISQLHTIAEFISFITDRVTTSQLRLSPPLVNFRHAVSGEDFDVKDRPARPERAIEIQSAAARLRIALRGVDYDRRKLHLPFS